MGLTKHNKMDWQSKATKMPALCVASLNRAKEVCQTAISGLLYHAARGSSIAMQ